MITANDKTLFVSDEGDGEALLMLPGLGATTSAYQPQAAALKASNRVVRLDMAGAGRSPHNGPLSIGDWADDAVAVLDHLGISTVTLVAHSLGTLVACDLIQRYPAYARSLVALGPVRAQPEKVKAMTRARGEKARHGGMEAVVDAVMAMAVSDSVALANPLVPTVIRESLLAQPPIGYAASCDALATAEDPQWDRVTVPTWIVAGDEDKLATPELVDTIAGAVPHATRECVARAGHWLSIEKPDLVTATIRKALTA